MADETIRSFSVYVDGEKLGTATGHAYDIDSNAELAIGDGIVLGVSQAVKTCKIVADTIIPFGGKANLRKLLDALLNSKKLQIGVGVLGAQIHKIDMYCTNASFKSETAKGMATGNWTLLGGKPVVVG